SGGVARSLVVTDDASGFFGGMSWTEDGIVWSGPGTIARISGDGGRPDTLVKLNAAESAERPEMLPGGKTLLYTLATTFRPDRWEKSQLVAQQISSGKRKIVLQPATDGRYVPTGHIVYGTGGSLFALPFDLATLEVKGGPVPVVQGVRRDAAAATGVVHFAF